MEPARSREITIIYLYKMLKHDEISCETKTKIKKVIKRLIRERKNHKEVLERPTGYRGYLEDEENV